MIVVLVGRRPDDKDAPVHRFPETNEDLVRARIRQMLDRNSPGTLVTSAAAGVDLIGLEEAGDRGIRRRVILPLDVERFRAASVADQGEQWSRRFDAIRSQVEPVGDLIIHPAIEDESLQDAFLRVVRALLDESLALAALELASEGAVDISPASRVVAVVIWDGVSHGVDDVSAAFIAEAEARGIGVEEISTL